MEVAFPIWGLGTEERVRVVRGMNRSPRSRQKRLMKGICRSARWWSRGSGQLAGKSISITQKAGVDGKLFGSVTNHDIAEELGKQGYKVAKSQVRLPNGPIKVVGDTKVGVSLHTDVLVEITVTVYGETT